MLVPLNFHFNLIVDARWTPHFGHLRLTSQPHKVLVRPRAKTLKIILQESLGFFLIHRLPEEKLNLPDFNDYIRGFSSGGSSTGGFSAGGGISSGGAGFGGSRRGGLSGTGSRFGGSSVGGSFVGSCFPWIDGRIT